MKTVERFLLDLSACRSRATSLRLAVEQFRRQFATGKARGEALALEITAIDLEQALLQLDIDLGDLIGAQVAPAEDLVRGLH